MRKLTTKTKNDDFGVLILTHGRPDSVLTVDSLRKQGYTGPIKIVLDDEEKHVETYRERFGEENVIIFSKKEASEIVDVMDNQGHFRGVVFARNASFGIAKALGWESFLMLDDDYTSWRWRFGSDRRYCVPSPVVGSLDRVFAALIEFMRSTPSTTIALAQDGEFIGGYDATIAGSISVGPGGKRKAMNTFLCRTDRPFRFSGRINEDVNAYVFLGSTGSLFFTANQVTISQPQTQQTPGGLTELYRDSGTYVKSFYTVIGAPSCVKVFPLIGTTYPRWHHRIKWRHAVPKILREGVRK